MMYDLHVHSIYSKDSLLKPADIIKIAQKKGLAGVAITDHQSIKGGIVASRLNTDKQFQVIVGSEIKTEYGDVIGLFLQEDISSRVCAEVIDEIKVQGGLAVLAHPFRKNIVVPPKIISMFDCIEAFNARSRELSNMKARKLAEDYKKPVSAGSDAHLGFEIGGGKINFDIDVEKSLRLGLTQAEGERPNYYLVHGMSVVIEKIKPYLG